MKSFKKLKKKSKKKEGDKMKDMHLITFWDYPSSMVGREPPFSHCWKTRNREDHFVKPSD
jgi:hypothetical protein